MGLFSKLFKIKPRTPTPIEEATSIINRFATATIMGIDREDLGRYPAKQHQVMAFHFGAIRYLADQYDLDETATLGLFVAFIDSYFNLPVTETGSISERLKGFDENTEEHTFLEAGGDVFRRWHEDNDRRAPLQLGAMLKSR